MLRNLLKWARRDRRTALLLLGNLVALVLVIVILVLLLGPGLSQGRNPASSGGGTVTVAPSLPVNVVVASTPTAEPSITPLPPTVNPTQLSNLPNQGRSDAPPPPPAVQSRPTTQASPSMTATRVAVTPSPTSGRR